MDIAEIRKKAKQRKLNDEEGEASGLQGAPESSSEPSGVSSGEPSEDSLPVDSSVASDVIETSQDEAALEEQGSVDANQGSPVNTLDPNSEAPPEALLDSELDSKADSNDDTAISNDDNSDEDEALLLEIQRLEAAQLLEFQAEEPEPLSTNKESLEVAAAETASTETQISAPKGSVPAPTIETPPEAISNTNADNTNNTEVTGDSEDDKNEEVALQAIAFMLDDEEYAIEIDKLKEIITTRELTDVPRAPDGIMGVLSLRGVMVPVLNLRSRFGLPPKEDGNRIIIVKDEDNDELLGLLVDSVRHVVRIPLNTLEPPPTLNTIDEELIKGIGRYEGGSFILLDTERMLEKI